MHESLETDEHMDIQFSMHEPEVYLWQHYGRVVDTIGKIEVNLSLSCIQVSSAHVKRVQFTEYLHILT